MSKFSELNVEGLMLINDLIQTNSLKKTAKNLHLSDPAAYRLLVKLRKIFNDDLFTRNGFQMMPTAKSLSIKDKVGKGLTLLDDLNKDSEKFDLSTLNKTFRIAVHEAMFAVHFPPLCQAISEVAPNVKIEIINADNRSLEDLKAARLDYAIMPMDIFVSKGIISLPLFDVSWAMLVRKDHPVLKKAKNGCISFKDISKFKVILVSIDSVFESPYSLPRGLDSQIEKGNFFSQEIAVWVPYVCAALSLVRSSDLTYLTYSRLADIICEGDKEVCKIAIDPSIGTIPMALKWNENFNSDVANQWFRSVLVSVCKETANRPSKPNSLRFSK